MLAGAALALAVVALVAPHLVGWWWAWRSSNPVRRGTVRAVELGCFHCHGWLGDGGLADPGGRPERVPGWAGGDWTTYVMDESEVRAYIADGYAGDPDGEAALRHHDDNPATVAMPAYRSVLRGSDMDDLVAAFKVLSGMSRPPSGSAARRGLEVAVRWNCFACHGPAGAGGLMNPDSLTGFIPGWYGADFRELVRDREEFDAWIRKGKVPRLAGSKLAAYFLRRQRVAMPAYPAMTDDERADLWSYCVWLSQTDGGHLRLDQPGNTANGVR